MSTSLRSTALEPPPGAPWHRKLFSVYGMVVLTVVLFAVAGVLALMGKKEVSQATPPEPSAAINSVKADVDEVKHAVKDRSRA